MKRSEIKLWSKEAFPRRLRNSRVGGDWTALVLTGGGWPGDYDIVRSLGHHGIRLAVASSDLHSVAFHSRFVSHKIILPPLEPEHETEILAALVRAGREQETPPVLFYVGDSELLFVARYARTLSLHYRFLLPERSLLKQVTDKGRFCHLAADCKLPVPHTVVVSSFRELVQRIDAVKFPCIVKPAFNREWFPRPGNGVMKSYKNHLRKFTDKREMLEFCRTLPSWDKSVLVQSYIDGAVDGTVSFLGYFDEHSRCLGSFLGKEVRTHPAVTGDTTLAEIIENEYLEEFSIDLLQRLRMKGIVKVDYVWDGADQKYKILEIEPHYQSWHLLGAYGGRNLALLAYHHQRKEPMITAASPPVRRRSLLYFRPDLTAYIESYRKTGRWPLWKYLRSIGRKHCYRIFDAGDVRPFLASLVNFCRRFFLAAVSLPFRVSFSKQKQVL